MDKLEVILSGFSIHLPSLTLESHKFIVEESEKPKVYVARASKHYQVTSQFNVKNLIVGSGNLYLDENKNLVLNGSSIVYGAVSKEAALKIGSLISKELKKHDIKVKDIVLDLEGTPNAYWTQIL
ncbi:MAG TPA: hypothetical protein VJB94_00900 [Candidatus Nanoarchaeia archaeon]|nr:hypothetical protein [Candidatus Nanoarchaeia archaeon]